MKTFIMTLLLILGLGLSACLGSPDAPAEIVLETAESADADQKPVLKTSIGDFAIASARWVDEVNGVKPGEGEKILLLILTKPDLANLDPGEFSLEAFDRALRDFSNDEVHLSGDDGSYAISTMAGWVGEDYGEFAIGFRLTTTARYFRLFWPGNEPIDIIPVN